MPRFQVGEAVQIATREQVPADVKSGLYYAHYAGLRGTILKIYGEEASVLVNRETLPKEIRVRHDEGEATMRQRWLDGLSDEARNRMSAREKQFTLNYAVLVALNDLAADTTPAETEAKRASEDDLNAAEEAFLAQRKNGSNGSGKTATPGSR